ncbi:hypothetical protein EG327_008011 [Venturia inaequalis]|uniref:Uncharacterized protein n=1 Tax=Venturia inaequalis TaxID=5025 RepID=A0A8H3YWG0_VENIN|nr:hypothetical protein EG327_008011 [Venturia inaequalis]
MFTDKQSGPLKLRLAILDSFMKKVSKDAQGSNLLEGQPGALTIVDLTDPTIDTNTACVLFDIALAVFLEQTITCGKIVGLDEAHNYLHNGAASENFTNNLLKAVREQRHRATRVVIATQEPTVSPKFLNLCSMIFVHGFNSPEWLATLQSHVAGAASVSGDLQKIGRRFLDDIVGLNTGQSFLFSRLALLDVKNGNPVKLGAEVRKFKTRQRLTHDGGRSQNATEQAGLSSL